MRAREALDVDEASRCFAQRLADDWLKDRVTTVTWINHHGALEHLTAKTPILPLVDYIGIDGLLLMRLLRHSAHERTSADLVLPLLLPRLQGARIALVGSDRASVGRAAEVVAKGLLAPGATLVDVRDGFEGLPARSELATWVRSHRPDVVIVGLGTVRQERWALDVAGVLPAGLVLTCGGFFDQVHQGAPYYPSWAYALRLNWAVRLVREPRRLWRRYSVEALEAVMARERLQAMIEGLSGYLAYRSALTMPSITLTDGREYDAFASGDKTPLPPPP